MKISSMNARRFALSGVAAAALCVMTGQTLALGLGRVSVQSALGEALRAEIDVTSLTPEEAASLRVRVAPPESYRAAGVEYNSVLAGTQATVSRRPDGKMLLRLSSDRAVQEPFVDVILELSWSSGRLVREYTMLFDPPSSQAIAQPVQVAPAISAAPLASPAQQPTVPLATREPARPKPPAPARSDESAAGIAPKQAVVPSGSPQVGGEYRVTAGDSLSRIAGRTQRAGVSLDQMLVALFHGNPQAFIDNNMNRLKAGSVLSVPTVESAAKLAPEEARKVIQAQSADFNAYRQRLAGVVPRTPPGQPARLATGAVQAQVEDQRQGAVMPPDKLMLSQGAVQASAPAVRPTKPSEVRDPSARVAELSKNLEDLKKLSDAATKAEGGALVAAPMVPVASGPAVEVSSSMPTVPAASVASAPVPASEAKVSAAPVAAAPASAAQSALEKKRADATDSVGAGSILDNPLVLPGAGVLVILLAGLGFYRLRNKLRGASGETSFLESRLQPDSFFGVSGGQRIDTRDAGGSASSMSYSLSQLDAIGDVDPVAEADVYLAYGRDLQAEEILKEAMRSTPERLAIRTKLLEVYAKRRDTKGYELLAIQLYGLTDGGGDEWKKAQELGQQIDPENALYQPGGRPADIEKGGAALKEPLGASTMPQSVMPSPSTFGASVSQFESAAPTESSLDLDLDLDLGTEAKNDAMRAMETTQALAPSAGSPSSGNEISFDLPEPSAPQPASGERAEKASNKMPPAPRVDSAPMDFDMGSFSLDLDSSPADGKTGGALDSTIDMAEPEPPSAPEVLNADTDPLYRKLELADEFRQIGDVEGARDLLEEVVAKSSGALKVKAQSLLKELA